MPRVPSPSVMLGRLSRILRVPCIGAPKDHPPELTITTFDQKLGRYVNASGEPVTCLSLSQSAGICNVVIHPNGESWEDHVIRAGGPSELARAVWAWELIESTRARYLAAKDTP